MLLPLRAAVILGGMLSYRFDRGRAPAHAQPVLSGARNAWPSPPHSCDVDAAEAATSELYTFHEFMSDALSRTPWGYYKGPNAALGPSPPFPSLPVSLPVALSPP